MDNCLSVNCDGEINAGVRSDDDWLPLGGSETALFCSAFSPLLLTPPGFEPPPRSGLDFDFAAHRTPRRGAAFLLPLDEKAAPPIVRDLLRPVVVVVLALALPQNDGDKSIIVLAKRGGVTKSNSIRLFYWKR